MHPYQKAFTLLELLCVLALVAILSTAGVHVTHHWFVKHRLRIEAQHLLHTISLGRLRAIASGYPVVLCSSVDKKHCVSDWSKEKILFIDRDADHICGPQDTMLRVLPAIHPSIILSWKSASSGPDIYFLPNGLVAMGNGRLILKAKHDDDISTTLMINRVGRVRLVG